MAENRTVRTIPCLLVEDSQMMRRLIKFALGRVEGIEVDEAENGFEALRKLAEKDYELIVTDLNMPIMDGLKLIHQIRASDKHSGVPIIVVTTERGAEDRSRALAIGATDYITKPIKAAEIVASVRRILDAE